MRDYVVMRLLEWKFSFQLVPIMLGLNKYEQSYNHLKLLQSGPIEIEKWLIIYYLWENILDDQTVY